LTFETYFSNKFKTPQNRHFLFPIFEINCRFPCSYQFNFVSLQTKIIDMIEVYTDGGCRHNPGLGAWAFIITENDKIVCTRSCYFQHTTNNEMELKAIYHALLYVRIFGETEAVIYSDSQYSINCITLWYPQWLSKGIVSTKKNSELITNIHNLMSPSIRLEWVKGHADNKYNIAVDRLVNDTMDSAILPRSHSH